MSELFRLENTPGLYVDTPESLALCVKRLESVAAIAVDTEFIRVSTFFPKLALLQIYDGQNIYLIDAPTLSSGFEMADEDFVRLWQGLVSVFTSHDVVKIFHACDEDLELLHYFFGAVPNNIFDTQLAAGFVNFDYPMSYQKIVMALCQSHIEKGDSRSNWLQRPLSQSQLSYAANDVVYLLDIHQQLLSLLKQQDKLVFFEQDCVGLLDALTVDKFDQAYLKIKSHDKLSAIPLWRLQQLCVWREKAMRLSDVPRNKVAKNDALMMLAQKGQSILAWIYKVEGLPGATVKAYIGELERLLSASPVQAELEYFTQRAGLDKKALKQAYKKVRSYLQAVAVDEGYAEQVLIQRACLEAAILQLTLNANLVEIDWSYLLGDNWRLQHFKLALEALSD